MAGSGGSAGTSGSGGAPVEATLVVLASALSGQPFSGVYTEATGWKGTSLPEPGILGKPAVVATGGGKAQALVRVFSENAEQLWSSSWSGGSWGSFAKVGPGYGAQDGPSYSVSSQTSWATYRRGGKHFALTFKGGNFGTEEPLGTDNPQAFGNSHATVLVHGATAWGVYAGANQGLYVLFHNGSSWTASAPLFGAGTKNYITPAMIHDDKNQLTVFFVRNTDSKICSIVRDGNGWTQPVVVLNDAITDSSPVAVQAPSGMYLVWRGFIGDDGVYFSFRPGGGSWQAPKVIDSGSGGVGGLA
ncbi:MAG: hypothetical protein RMJ98_22025, partial [Myxococcales bacterium]|nr:hypothetical protein [Myxococcales bacterium]